jgi:hypothetical protein
MAFSAGLPPPRSWLESDYERHFFAEIPEAVWSASWRRRGSRIARLRGTVQHEYSAVRGTILAIPCIRLTLFWAAC